MDRRYRIVIGQTWLGLARDRGEFGGLCPTVGEVSLCMMIIYVLIVILILISLVILFLIITHFFMLNITYTFSCIRLR